MDSEMEQIMNRNILKPILASSLCLLIFVFSCSVYTNPSIAGGSATEIDHSGFYIYGHEANTFQPCGSTKVYWVIGDDTMVDELRRRYEEIAIQLYEEVYVSLTGEFRPKATDGFAADYDGLFFTAKIKSLRKKQNADCKP